MIGEHSRLYSSLPPQAAPLPNAPLLCWLLQISVDIDFYGDCPLDHSEHRLSSIRIRRLCVPASSKCNSCLLFFVFFLPPFRISYTHHSSGCHCKTYIICYPVSKKLSDRLPTLLLSLLVVFLEKHCY